MKIHSLMFQVLFNLVQKSRNCAFNIVSAQSMTVFFPIHYYLSGNHLRFYISSCPIFQEKKIKISEFRVVESETLLSNIFDGNVLLKGAKCKFFNEITY